MQEVLARVRLRAAGLAAQASEPEVVELPEPVAVVAVLLRKELVVGVLPRQRVAVVVHLLHILPDNNTEPAAVSSF